LLLKNGAEINAKDDDGYTALHFAIFYKNQNIANLLIHEGAETSANSKQDYTPLMAACETGQLTLVKLLVGMNATIDEKDKDWNTPMRLASKNGHLDIIRFLVDSGADITTYTQGWCSLYEASRFGYIEIVKFFISQGIGLKLEFKSGWRPLLAACYEGHNDIAMLLIENGAYVHQQTKTNYTTLMAAASKGLIDIAHILIEKGVSTNQQTKEGWTALIYSCNNGHGDVAKLLLENGADIDKKTDDKYTSLMGACKSGLTNMAHTLIEKGANVNAKTKEKWWSPLIIACLNGASVELVELLLENGAKINQKNYFGKRSYHYAFREEHDSLGKYLIAKGAKLYKHSRYGDDCYATAKAHRFKASSYESNGDMKQALEYYLIASEYFDKAAEKMMKLSQDYATGFKKGVGASIFSSLVGLTGTMVDMKNLQKGKQTHWGDIAPEVKTEEVEVNKKLSEEYAAKSVKCKQLSEECLEHINQLKEAGGSAIEG
jgi:ankyrin repeat protein